MKNTAHDITLAIAPIRNYQQLVVKCVEEGAYDFARELLVEHSDVLTKLEELLPHCQSKPYQAYFPEMISAHRAAIASALESLDNITATSAPTTNAMRKARVELRLSNLKEVLELAQVTEEGALVLLFAKAVQEEQAALDQLK